VPIRNGHHRFFGVGAIDLRPDEFMRMDQLGANWSLETRAFLVIPESHNANEAPRLKIMAAGNRASHAKGGLLKKAGSYLAIPDAHQRRALALAMQTAASGHMALR
jgi:hypothetical protein